MRGLGRPLPGCFAPGVMTFEHFAQSVLDRTAEPIRPISRFMRRQLIRQIIEEHRAAGRLQHFAAIASTGGLIELVCELIAEWKRLEIWPEDFQRACQSRGTSAKDGELLDIYQAYQQRLREHQLVRRRGAILVGPRLAEKRGRDERGQSHFRRTKIGTVPGAGAPPGRGRRLHRLHPHAARDPGNPRRAGGGDLHLAGAGGNFLSPSPSGRGAGGEGEPPSGLPLFQGSFATRPHPNPLPEAEGSRGDLFDKPRRTLAELCRRHAAVTVEELPRPEHPAWPALDHLERTLFGNPRHAQAGRRHDGDGGPGGGGPGGRNRNDRRADQAVVGRGGRGARTGPAGRDRRGLSPPARRRRRARRGLRRLRHSRGLGTGRTDRASTGHRGAGAAAAFARRGLAVRRLLAVVGNNYFAPTGRSGPLGGPARRWTGRCGVCRSCGAGGRWLERLQAAAGT